MSKRNYNVFFNTHTVSGIVISIVLYVIFFAGAFALFKDEITVWEEGVHVKHTARQDINYDAVLDSLSKTNLLKSRDLTFYLDQNTDDLFIMLGALKDTLNIPKDKHYANYLAINPDTGKTATYQEKYSLGEFLYRLHFLSQIPTLGIYLCGFVSLFFLFAMVTGVIVHWKKIISNFYSFNPKAALKRVWTDAHTALGIIGLPFQFIYAVTGAYFCLSLFVLIPANLLYNGDDEKLMADINPNDATAEWISESTKEPPSVNEFVKHTITRWENFESKYLYIKNFGGSNMKYLLEGDLHDKDHFLAKATVAYDVATNTTKVTQNPHDTNYTTNVQRLGSRLHFADFGGIPIKIIYFIMAIITCFVIITGVLIWIEARNKKTMSIEQRLYTAKIGHIYLATCLSFFPVVALSFLLVKWLPQSLMTHRITFLYIGFPLIWIATSVYFRFKQNNYFTNKTTLLIGAILGFLIPISNGIVSNNWVWNTYKAQQFDILTVDLLWLGLASTALFIYYKITPSVQEQSAFYKNPIPANQPLINTLKSKQQHDKNHIPMRTKIVILWIFLGIGWIVHHIYGLFNIYYNETLMMDGATGEAPIAHHIYRIVFEGLCLAFGLITLEVSKTWFRITSLIWACIAGVYNVYHVIEAIKYEASNISEIFMLLLVVVASVFLVKNLNEWSKNE